MDYLLLRAGVCSADAGRPDVRYVRVHYIYGDDCAAYCHHLYSAGYERIAFVAGDGAGQSATRRICQVCYGAGTREIYELILIQHKEREVCFRFRLHHSASDAFDYRTTGDRLGTGLSCILFGALSRGYARSSAFCRSVCGDLLCCRHSFRRSFYS